jgi:hypothetical protein
MPKRSRLCALAVLAAGAALVAGCSSSSSSSSSSTPSASAPASTAPASSAPATSASAPASTAAATAVSVADCKIINPISTGVAAKLMPLQSESKAKAEAGIKAYLAELTADEAKLTSPAGKAALGAFIKSLAESLTESTSAATTTLTTAIGALGSACS